MSETKHVVCRHGADNYLRYESTRTDTGYACKVTEYICKACVEDLRRAGEPKQ